MKRVCYFCNKLTNDIILNNVSEEVKTNYDLYTLCLSKNDDILSRIKILKPDIIIIDIYTIQDYNYYKIISIAYLCKIIVISHNYKLSQNLFNAKFGDRIIDDSKIKDLLNSVLLEYSPISPKIDENKLEKLIVGLGLKPYSINTRRFCDIFKVCYSNPTLLNFCTYNVYLTISKNENISIETPRKSVERVKSFIIDNDNSFIHSYFENINIKYLYPEEFLKETFIKFNKNKLL